MVSEVAEEVYRVSLAVKLKVSDTMHLQAIIAGRNGRGGCELRLKLVHNQPLRLVDMHADFCSVQRSPKKEKYPSGLANAKQPAVEAKDDQI